jgi:hypothetical protein
LRAGARFALASCSRVGDFRHFVTPITTVSAVVGAITMVTPLLTGPLLELVKTVVFRS